MTLCLLEVQSVYTRYPLPLKTKTKIIKNKNKTLSSLLTGTLTPDHQSLLPPTVVVILSTRTQAPLSLTAWSLEFLSLNPNPLNMIKKGGDLDRFDGGDRELEKPLGLFLGLETDL